MSLSYSVVICAYTLHRWAHLVAAVQSALEQTPPATEVILCVDHNPELLERAVTRWEQDAGVTVIENRYPGRLGSARNSALERVTGDIVAFLDDDAIAPVDWLARLDV